MIDISQDDFGTLCICAIRYCHGRQTYMPSFIQGIVRSHFKDLSDRDIDVMVEDCEFQRTMDLYGDEKIDKPGWLQFEIDLKEERAKRYS